MKIAVFGLGYVGSVTSACFAKLGNDVTGVDVVKYKVDAINRGETPVKEKELGPLIEESVKKGALKAITNTKKAVLNTEIAFVCVGTPPKINGNVDLTYLKRVCEEIGEAIRVKKHYTVVIRSTVFPGYLNLLKKTLEQTSQKKCGIDFDVAVNPEFLREGSSVKDFFSPPFVIVGAENKSIARKVLACYEGIDAKKFVVTEEVAQTIKYANNSFHALKVAFVNEIASICKKAGVDNKQLSDLFCEDKITNISTYYLRPGFAYGGSCLPKDLAALKNAAKKLGVKTPIINSIAESNIEHIKRAIAIIESKKRKSIGILGLTFKPNTDDIRGNPILFVINNLLNKGYDIKIFDKIIDKSNLKNISKSYRKEVFDLINRENLKEEVKDISKLFSNLDATLKQDVIVLSNRDASLKDCVENLSKHQVLMDLQDIFNSSDTAAEYNSLFTSPMKIKSITVGIPTYNEEKSISKSINSALNQISKRDEVIVVASGCIDNTVKEIKKIMRRDERVKLITEPERRGKASAINLIIKNAKGDVIVQTDGDVIVEEGAIKNIIKHFKDERIGAVSGNPVPLIPKNNLFYDWSMMSYRKIGEIRKKESDEGTFWHLSGYLLAFRKKVLKQVPFAKGAVDAWMGRIIKDAGYKLVYEPNAKVLVKCPTNIKDFVNQKARVRAGYQLLPEGPRKMQKEILLFPKELSKISFSRWPRFLFSGIIYFYTWIKGFYFAKTNKSLQQIWKVPVSTK